MAIDWHGWIIDEAQAKAIKRRENDAMNKFIIDNEKRIYRLIYMYFRTSFGKKRIEPEDLFNQVYVDLPYLNYKNGRLLSTSIIRLSFTAFNYGGYAQLREDHSKLLHREYRFKAERSTDELIKPHEKKSKAMLDFYTSTVPEYEKDDTDYFEELETLFTSFLSVKEFEYIKLKMQGYPEPVIYADYCISGSTRQSALDKVRIHYEDITKALIDSGCVAALPYQYIKSKLYDLAVENRAKVSAQAMARNAKRKDYYSNYMKEYYSKNKERKKLQQEVVT